MRSSLAWLVAVGIPQSAKTSYISLCGVSKRALSEDPNRRFCLSRCILEGSDIRPTFNEWETYCRETSGMDEWDPECYDFMTCAYGCAAYGGQRANIADKKPQERYDFIKATRDEMYGEGITQEKVAS
eukprot:CAMPEP_0169130082 /NCGR_PEP_ID=MMETSP1015-20121227/37501_1 /TAXON_ID=342587 /ORGANISM="Karlodinium micrum, Strain CCMP2283" /LENGTH=127 /DNA_ID=CAMNT_0009194207 /DNA_START=76 /DNA_END=460 /DNA_ORIENTATION=-